MLLLWLLGPLGAPLGAMAAPSIMSAVGGRIRNVQVLDGTSRLLTKSKHKGNPNGSKPTDIIHEPGVVTYIVGAGFFGLGSVLSATPIGPILMGLGLGMMGSGISSAAEAGGEEARRRRRK